MSAASSETSPVAFNHILGQGRVNQLGGMFINGRPLPHHIRVQIVEMANSGVKPCQISRQLRVSHGAVSKILNRFQETGSISPGQIGGNPRQRVSVQSLEKPLMIAFEENPLASGAELRQTLIEQGACSRATAPTVASINRYVRSRGWQKRQPERKKLSHSIDSILGISMVSDDSKSSSSDDDGTSPDTRRNRTSFTAEQLDLLEGAFRNNTYPDAAERETIAKRTGLSEDKIMTWFSNRRARSRKHLPVFSQILPTTTSPSMFPLPQQLPLFFPGIPQLVFSQFTNSV